MADTDQQKQLLHQQKHQLMILNSFTRKKEIFKTNQAKVIKWYTCGPTVYDVAHLGHARCYITFDIIRRILANYFGYQVFYVMNITDIDDKIIKRARSNHLCDQYKRQTIEKMVHADGQLHSKAIIDYVKEAIKHYQSRRTNETDPFKMDMIANIVKSSQIALSELEKYLVNIGEQTNDSIDKKTKDLEQILHKLNDIIADEQDIQLGHTIKDHEIFKTLTLHFEREFHDDMTKLGVLPASALTRVSEFIPETCSYIKRLEENGFAYKSQSGSIYFDTNKFNSDPRHRYAKLVPEAFSQGKTIDQDEGELSSQEPQEKRSPNDFALWKKSKPGEPSWTCEDFVAGRPGWHIECSVMASNLLGDNFDIHSGGCDLKFPHHDNEIAQAEAYFNTGLDWINYFMHSGHLTIAGCKMSKSLKNFITIRKALEDYTSRQLRFAFLAHGWTETLDYSDNTMNTAKSYERTFNEFFLNVIDYVRRKLTNLTSDGGDMNIGLKLINLYGKWSPVDHQLNKAFLDATDKVDMALCDNFDTRTALNSLSGLVKDYNKTSNCDFFLLKDIASYISRILHIFGTGYNEYDLERIFNITDIQSKASQSNNQSSQDMEAKVFKYVDAMAKFRADIRKASKLAEPKDSIKQILGDCDILRDVTLPNLGVRLEDKEVDGLPYVVKFVDPEVLAKERAEKELAKRIKEETSRIEKLKLAQEREKKMKMPPSEMFKSQLDKYSKFDDRGMPTHDVAGKEVSKSALKKLERLYAEQENRYGKYISEQGL